MHSIQVRAAGGEAETEGFGSPIIVGGFSPKEMEEKLSKAEAAKSMLKEDDFNVTTTSESYRFPPIDLLNKAKRSKGNAAEEEEHPQSEGDEAGRYAAQFQHRRTGHQCNTGAYGDEV